MATSDLIYIKRGPNASNWVVGIDDSVSITGVSQKSITGIDVNKNIESHHVKDADGIVRLSAYFNSSQTVSVTAIYEGTAPEPGETITCDGKTFYITSVSVRKAQASEGICTISAEYYAGLESSDA